MYIYIEIKYIDKAIGIQVFPIYMVFVFSAIYYPNGIYSFNNFAEL